MEWEGMGIFLLEDDNEVGTTVSLLRTASC